MAVDQKVLHVLAHYVRIRQVLDEKPDHPRSDEYAKTVRVYRLQWAILEPEQKAEVLEAAHEIPDLTPDWIASAVAALEA